MGAASVIDADILFVRRSNLWSGSAHVTDPVPFGMMQCANES